MFASRHGQRTQGASGEDVLLLLLRIAVVTVIGIFQLAPQAATGWAAIWHEKTWPLADTVTTLGIPQAQWVVASAVVLAFLSALGVACGFITRMSCIALLGGTALLGYTAVVETEVVQLELSLVYGCVLLFLLLRGPGYLSADRYFSNAASQAN